MYQHLQVSACLAASLDGKIAYGAPWASVPLGSKADRTRLKQLRDAADALIFGGESFRVYANARQGLQPGHQPIQALLSQSGRLPADAPLWHPTLQLPTRVYLPVGVPWTPPHPNVTLVRLPAEDTTGLGPGHATAEAVLADLCPLAPRSQVMVEGGGKMLALFWPFVDVLYLTLCPRMLGDHPGEAGLPSLFTGEALPPHTQPPLKLVACQPMGDELFLTYTKPN